jgi:hypothetical protein
VSRASLSAGWGNWKKTPFNIPGPSSGGVKRIERIRDIFGSSVTIGELWTGSYGGYSITNGRARVACDTTYTALASAAEYTLDESYIFAQVFPNARGGATGQAYTEMMVISTTAGTDLGFSYDTVTGDIGMINRVGYFDGSATYIAYNSTTMRYLRIASTGGAVGWDTSPDGITWTNRRYLPVGPSWIRDTTLAISFNSHRNDGVNDYAEIDNVNVIPVSGMMTAGSGVITPTLNGTRGRHGILTAGAGAITPTLLAEVIKPDITSDPYVLITNENLEFVGDPIVVQSVEITQNFNEPDSGSFTTTAYPEYMDVFQPGNRAVIMVDGEIFSHGPIEKPGGYKWDVGGEEEPGTITINFAGDLSSIAARLTYPNPDFEAWEQPIAYYESTFNAEAVIRDLVIRNAGAWAKTARRVPKLILGDVAGVGTPIVCKTRFEPVTDVARALAISGGGLGFRVRQVGTNLVFTVFEPEDKSGIARFSRGLGNLRSVAYDISKPIATTAIVGGDGTGDTRTIAERINTTAEADWGRVEVWVGAQSQDAGTGGLNQTGDETLAQSGEEVQLTTVTVDTGDVRFGKHYNMGDLVTVEVYPGVEVKETVRSAHFTYSPEEGKQISILVGSQSATRDPEWVRITRQLSTRVGRLERT